jgi:hypothetical protein
MCDFSLKSVKSRDANVADKLITHNFGTGTKGFADPMDTETAVCVLPGTEIAFNEPVSHSTGSFFVGWSRNTTEHKTAIFRQINKDSEHQHHDCLEFPDGTQMLLTALIEGQHATILQLPAAPKNEQEAKDQERLAISA